MVKVVQQARWSALRTRRAVQDDENKEAGLQLRKRVLDVSKALRPKWCKGEGDRVEMWHFYLE